MTDPPRRLGRPRSNVSISLARRLRKSMTEQEAHVWSRLKPLRAAGYHFRRQVPIDRYIVDFACLKKQVVVEIDGGQHGADDARDADAERDRILTSRGFRVLLFWNSAVREDIDSVIETIVARSDGRE